MKNPELFEVSNPDAVQSKKTGADSRLHLPVLDGIRGLAILLVLLHHTLNAKDNTWLGRLTLRVSEFGWTGVDLFFVLSGFLITGILIDGKSKKNYFKNFYVRRVLRIFPLYYAYLIVLGAGLVGYCLFIKHGFPSFAVETLKNVGYSLIYATNFRIAYVGQFISTPINHFWSLAIEEQFYFVWPLMVFFLSSKTMIRLSVAIIFGALAMRLAIQYSGLPEVGSHVLTPCRADCLAFGALIAYLVREPAGLDKFFKLSKIIFALGFVAIASIVLVHGYKFPQYVQNFVYSLNALVFAALMLIVLNSPSQSPWVRVFSNPVLRSFGKYAYALYVFNQLVAFNPVSRKLIARLLNIGDTGLIGTAIYCIYGICATYLLALASWHLLEKHFLKLKKYFE